MGYSIISALLLFYLVAANGLNQNLLAKQLQTWIAADRIIQHIVSCILLFVIVLILTKMSLEASLVYSLIGYGLFILSTKLDLQFNIIVFIILMLGFLYERYLTLKEEQVKEDPILNQEDKQNIISNFANNQFMLVIGTILVTLTGTYVYLHRKQIQYGGSFDYTTFLLH